MVDFQGKRKVRAVPPSSAVLWYGCCHGVFVLGWGV